MARGRYQKFAESLMAESQIRLDRQLLRDLCREAGLSRSFEEHVVNHLKTRQAHWMNWLIAGGDPDEVPEDLAYLRIADYLDWLTEEQLDDLGLLEAAESRRIAITPEVIRKAQRKRASAQRKINRSDKGYTEVSTVQQ